MFLEDEDWNDDRRAEVQSSTKPKENCSSAVKTKAVGKKSLLRTLQTLGSVPNWSEQPQRHSDSETETHPTEHAHKKRKKRRKRKHSETTVEQTENGDLSQKGTEDTAVVKKKNQKDKLGKKRNFTTTDETHDQETPKPAKVEQDSPEKQMSRQQWKNKMKNKRKCKNKFKSNPTAQDVHEEDTGFNCNVTNKKSESKEFKNKVEKLKVDRPVKITKTISDENRVVIKDKHIELAQHQKSELRIKHNLKKEKLRKLLQSQSLKQKQEVVVVPKEVVNPPPPDPPEAPDASASLRTRMEQRLESARFRYINEVLYSSTSGEAKRMFTQDPQAFWVYHRGYSTQVQRWPTNPVDNIIQFIQTRPRSHVVADFGCGDCKIAQSVRNKVHSFDLVATCDLVTACDMANVPLKDSSVDMAVFCLSLMGTNLADFIKEANRVLKMGGVLKIAEVSSRFDNVRSFIAALAELGFKLVSKDTENTHFYSFDFVKTGPAPDSVKKSGLQLKPCVYKRR